MDACMDAGNARGSGKDGGSAWVIGVMVNSTGRVGRCGVPAADGRKACGWLRVGGVVTGGETDITGGGDVYAAAGAALCASRGGGSVVGGGRGVYATLLRIQKGSASSMDV